MRIAILVDRFVGAPPTLAAEFSADLARALRQLEHDVQVFAPFPATNAESLPTLARRLSKLDDCVEGVQRSWDLFDGRTPSGVLFTLIRPAEASARDTDSATKAVQTARDSGASGMTQTPSAEPHHPDVQAQASALTTVLLAQDDFDAVHCVGPLGQRVLALLQQRAPKLVGRVVWSWSQGDVSACELPLSVEGSAQARVVVADTGSQRAFQRAWPQWPSRRIHTIAPAVDGVRYSPAGDPRLRARFDPFRTEGKATCRHQLRFDLGFSMEGDPPLVGCIIPSAKAALGRLATQLQQLLAAPRQGACQLVLTPDSRDRRDIGDIEALQPLLGGQSTVPDFPPTLRMVSLLDPSPVWLAALDALVLVQADEKSHVATMLAQRYGTLPLVASGSAEALGVVDFDAHQRSGSAFVWDDGADRGLQDVLDRLESSYARPGRRAAVCRQLMRIDNSWERRVRQYEWLYQLDT